ncbi:ATP-binding protein [Levilactobacillus acidifarinae]|uniref:ATPase n=1 Tax=Levilactobacillus acidifarinae DSM 19394 = JCM 15949 TaxID=1423715 RepID=A0A0R1LNV2_9LACO|nr:ATP-binding protein [Levilactobacillus acidifarinae]KRK94377.1 ATPase [Levilactobacillus acidifarinae DSM 19394]GEO68117.1 ATPase [Levilactobacillus acidifarinae]
MALTYQQCLQAIQVVLASGSVPTIVGEAGIGKSALVADVAQHRHAKLFTTVVSLVEKGDLVIPVPPLTSDSFIQTAHYGQLADVQFGYSHTLVSLIRYAEDHPNDEIIWFLDEFNRGTQAVQSELMNLVLQRQINSLTLPKQVHLILAENPDATMQGFTTSHYGVTPGDAAIADRTTRLVLQADTPTWLTWAQTRVGDQPRVSPLVTDYLTANPSDLFTAPTGDQEDADLQPTPRAWARVSRLLRELDRQELLGTPAIVQELLVGNLGATVGTAFAGYVRTKRPTLTVAQLYTRDAAVTTFQTLNPAQQQRLLIQCLDAVADWPLTRAATAERFTQLLMLCAPDGQFAVARTLAQRPGLLESLYQQVNTTTAVSQLYAVLTQIGKRSSQIEV